MLILADKGYAGADAHIHTPYKGKDKPEPLKDANRSHAKLRGPGERANAQLKSWKILTKLRCCPHRAGHLAKAIHVLQNRELNARGKRGGYVAQTALSALFPPHIKPSSADS